MKLALIGDPVEQSRSPKLQHRFLRHAGIAGSYVALRVERGGAVAAIERLAGQGFAGCNVTYPLKEEALAACPSLTEHASRARAVNTIAFADVAIGTNTDGVGARVALETLTREPIALKRVGVLGYGATARAILAELHATDAYAYVWGRNAQTAIATCAQFEAEAWPSDPPEIVVSTLPPDAEVPDPIVAALRRAVVVLDANYGSRATLGVRIGREVFDGTALLEAQARASFDFWLTHAPG